MLMMLACTGKETALTLMIVEIKLTVLMLMMLAATAKRDALMLMMLTGTGKGTALMLMILAGTGGGEGADADDAGRHWRRARR